MALPEISEKKKKKPQPKTLVKPSGFGRDCGPHMPRSWVKKKGCCRTFVIITVMDGLHTVAHSICIVVVGVLLYGQTFSPGLEDYIIFPLDRSNTLSFESPVKNFLKIGGQNGRPITNLQKRSFRLGLAFGTP
jgi:hypothetical protein